MHRIFTFDEYTPEARRVMFFASVFARQPDSRLINTEHLLIGLERENLELLNRFLRDKITEEAFHRDVADNKPTLISHDPPRWEFTDAGMRVLSFAAEEANRTTEHQVGIDHLLLGLLREEDSQAARMLRERGADVARIREELSTNPHRPPPTEERMSREIDKIFTVLAKSQKPPAQVLEKAATSDDALRHYTVRAQLLVFAATREASRLGSPAVKTEHLLSCMLQTSILRFRLFLPLADSNETVRKRIDEHLGTAVNPSQQRPAPERLPLSDEYQRVLNYAEEEAILLGSEQIAPEHLLLGVLREKDSYAAVVLREYGAETERIRRELVA